MPVLSIPQLNKQFSEDSVPVILLGAIYASALPFVVHDQALFVLGTYNESMTEVLWRIVYQMVHDELHSPKLAVLQSALLYLQRLPARHQRAVTDTPSRLSFLGSTVALAMSLGLHLEPRPWGIPAWEKRLRRRLWWAVYLEDKWTSLLLGRPPIIHPDEWDIWDLEDSDLEDIDGTALGGSVPVEGIRRDVVFSYFVGLSKLVDRIHETF
jgi:hypothetical protein